MYAEQIIITGLYLCTSLKFLICGIILLQFLKAIYIHTLDH